ncbi:unnamed protein product [Thelazia callipaeda]|uniref:SIS domain-containing protein n=1 Tax=Thelazia callipaeda TaxID=103827 RepID=A0A0N5CT48_THECL|nr:unnamed protein product [Thelazia callipaeda]
MVAVASDQVNPKNSTLIFILSTSNLTLSEQIQSLKIHRPSSLTLIGITCAETIESMFPNWVNLAFQKTEKDFYYLPYNLNMPGSIISRPIEQYPLDSPITVHGQACATLIGQGILHACYEPTAVYLSSHRLIV